MLRLELLAAAGPKIRWLELCKEHACGRLGRDVGKAGTCLCKGCAGPGQPSINNILGEWGRHTASCSQQRVCAVSTEGGCGFVEEHSPA